MRSLIIIVCLLLPFNVPGKTLPDVLDEVMPNIVRIDIISEDPKVVEKRIGSGFYISPYDIITNSHVIGEGKIYIRTGDDAPMRRAVLIGRDRHTDIALLRVVGESGVKGLKWADKDTIRTGNDILIIGSPYNLSFSVSKGIISHLDRRRSEYPARSTYQVDASANSGSSGGPLMNLDGEALGVVVSIGTSDGGGEGITFAVRGDLAREAVARIRNEENVNRIILGFVPVEINMMNKDAYEIETPAVGIYISEVVEGFPIAKAGIKQGDILVSVDGIKFLRPRDLADYFHTKHVGDKSRFIVFRNGLPLLYSVLLTNNR